MNPSKKVVALWPCQSIPLRGPCYAVFLLRFEIVRTIVVLTGTEKGGGAPISARSAKLG